MPEYSTVSIPKEMMSEVDRIIKEHPELGFTSVADFCKASVRNYIYFIEYNLKQGHA